MDTSTYILEIPSMDKTLFEALAKKWVGLFRKRNPE